VQTSDVESGAEAKLAEQEATIDDLTSKVSLLSRCIETQRIECLCTTYGRAFIDLSPQGFAHSARNIAIILL